MNACCFQERAGEGPIPEFDYWHEREAAFSTIVEQLKKKEVLKILHILELAQNPIGSGFIHYENELRKYYAEARENVKFLYSIVRYLRVRSSTIKFQLSTTKLYVPLPKINIPLLNFNVPLSTFHVPQHYLSFQNITNTRNFEDVTKCIPNLMKGLNMIWVLSRFYNTDETMVPLCERIVWTMRYKVATILDVKLLFQQPLQTIEAKTAAAKEMLETWKKSYMYTRDQIELIGKANRWEFDKTKLFADSDYMARVCGDLNEIATVSSTTTPQRYYHKTFFR